MANNPPAIVADAVLSACPGRFAGWEEAPITGNRIRRVVYRVLMTGTRERCRDKASKWYRHGSQDHSHGARGNHHAWDLCGVRRRGGNRLDNESGSPHPTPVKAVGAAGRSASGTTQSLSVARRASRLL